MADDTKKTADTSLQKALAKDLGVLQARLEHYEDALPKELAGSEGLAYCKSQVEYYREETRKVRAAVLELHALAMAELKR